MDTKKLALVGAVIVAALIGYVMFSTNEAETPTAPAPAATQPATPKTQ